MPVTISKSESHFLKSIPMHLNQPNLVLLRPKKKKNKHPQPLHLHNKLPKLTSLKKPASLLQVPPANQLLRQ